VALIAFKEHEMQPSHGSTETFSEASVVLLESHPDHGVPGCLDTEAEGK